MRRCRAIATVVVFGPLLAACAQSGTAPKAPSNVQPMWGTTADSTAVHRPSGLTLPSKVSVFERTHAYFGEWEDLHALYAADSGDGTIRVDFSGSIERLDGVACPVLLDQIASRQDQRADFNERLESWQTIAPLFSGMETGRAATFAHRKLSTAGKPMESEIYILCGANWTVQYRADYPQGTDAGEWIRTLIAATAP